VEALALITGTFTATGNVCVVAALVSQGGAHSAQHHPRVGPEGLFFVVLDTHKRGRYPRAAHAGATIYHYGWVRSETQMNLKTSATHKFWDDMLCRKPTILKSTGHLKRIYRNHPGSCKRGCRRLVVFSSRSAIPALAPGEKTSAHDVVGKDLWPAV